MMKMTMKAKNPKWSDTQIGTIWTGRFSNQLTPGPILSRIRYN
jgi:hypothetical protein